MNKGELKSAVHARLEEKGFASPSQAQTNRAVDSVLEVIEEALVSGDDVAIQGFGTFKISFRAARKGRNVRTGEEIEIPERRVVKFKPGKSLKDAVIGK